MQTLIQMISLKLKSLVLYLNDFLFAISLVIYGESNYFLTKTNRIFQVIFYNL